MGTTLIDNKIKYWQNQLLDLGKRNKMISFKETKRATLRIVEPDFNSFYNRFLIKEEELTFQRPIDKESDIRMYSILSLMDSLSVPIDIQQGDIKTNLSYEETVKTLKNLRNKARLSLDEQGTNILYLVFGFIEWREKGSKDDWIKSPLILVPASLVLESLNAPYILKKYDDDVVVNPTLAYLFERDYGITLPEFDSTEDSIDDFMKKMEKLVDVRGWRVIRESALGLVSFLKISMYKDFLNNENEIRKNPIIQAFSGDLSFVNNVDLKELDFDHDSLKASDIYQVMNADSSQQDAIVLSQKGVSFVMQGPPGTGKSQTITNIIAQGLADGKKILFVSEKMAALEVVHKRLEEVHLSDFCLSLHSHKANKKDVLEQLGQNLNLKKIKVKDEEIAKLTRLDMVRDDLKGYVGDIHHTINPLEMSLYEVYGVITQLEDLPDISLGLFDTDKLTKDDVNRLSLLIEKLETLRFSLGRDWYNNPWQGIIVNRLGPVQKTELKDTINDLIRLINNKPETCNLPVPFFAMCNYENIKNYYDCYSYADKCYKAPDEWLHKNLDDERDLINDIKDKRNRISSLHDKILNDYDERIFVTDKEAIFGPFEMNCKLIQETINPGYSSDTLFKSCNELMQGLNSYYEDINTVNEVSKKFSERFSVERAGCFEQLEKYLTISEILIEKDKINSQIKSFDDRLLLEYEPSVFNIDYENMLKRFKAEYVGVFRIFKKQYREDIKQIRLVNRNVKKVSDSDAISLLTCLRERDELVKNRDAQLDRIGVILGYNSFYDKEAFFTEQDVAEYRNLINRIKKYKDEYIKIDQSDFDSMLIRVSYAQKTVLDLIKSVEYINSFVKISKQYSEIKAVFFEIKMLNALQNDYEDRLSEASKIFSFERIDENYDWSFIEELINAVDTLKSIPQEKGIDENWIYYIADLKFKNESNAWRSYLESIISNKDKFESFINLYDENNKKLFCDFTKLLVRLKQCAECFGSLDEWIDYRECEKLCADNNLSNFVEQSIDIQYPEGKLKDVFLKAFYYLWIEKQIAKLDRIQTFNQSVQCDKVKQFRELDMHQLPVAQMRIREKLISGMPSRSVFNRSGDEMSVLIHELGKKRKIMPLRKLFKSIPNLLLKLKPCLMMSPLSVSYFLEADTYKFDMVIFDEASQIFPQDAIGAIFRGKQVIIAGDSKQLPPTNFFAANTNNDYDFDAEEDDYDEIISDSILEEATKSLVNRSLLWHYRSRYEDLISFSNKEIYGNNLVTFPSSKVNEADSGVEYIYVNKGVYENRCNLEEANRCVDLIEMHIKTHPERSLGVVAFSESQQSAIEDAVHEFRRKHMEYDYFFSEDKEEEFFIKNLENVQGDERDTIIFSICYGKNAQGRMYMRFGPLGHQGGERRLNVAITRAKYNVKLVGSIRPEDIDLNKTNSEGVKMLRKYIEFASRSHESIINKIDDEFYETDLFCNSVSKFLESNGYKVKRNVGSSDYRVDMAVEHPDIAGAYVVGIECDGDTYYKARTVRDRDNLRTTVMEQMGWKMYRIWSTEWFQNENNAKQRLLKYISEAINNYSKYESKENKHVENIIDTVNVVSKEENNLTINRNNPYNLERYQEGHWWDVKMFRANDNRSQIADRIHEVVRVEQPIHLELLYKRMAGCFGNEKVTSPIRYTVDLVIKTNMSNELIIDKEKFITLSDFKGIKVRRSLSGSPDRNIEYISLMEIEEAMKYVLNGAFGVEVSVLILETARIFGFEKTGVKIKQRMSLAVDSLCKKGLVRVSDGKAQLLEV